MICLVIVIKLNSFNLSLSKFTNLSASLNLLYSLHILNIPRSCSPDYLNGVAVLKPHASGEPHVVLLDREEMPLQVLPRYGKRERERSSVSSS